MAFHPWCCQYGEDHTNAEEDEEFFVCHLSHPLPHYRRTLVPVLTESRPT